jgi:hypothetical protein
MILLRDFNRRPFCARSMTVSDHVRAHLPADTNAGKKSIGVGARDPVSQDIRSIPARCGCDADHGVARSRSIDQARDIRSGFRRRCCSLQCGASAGNVMIG